MLQIILDIVIFLALVIPAGHYLYKVADNKKSFVDPVLDRVDNAIYRISGIDKGTMGWQKYAVSLFVTNMVMMCAAYALLRLQGALFINPGGIAGMPPSLAFNTAISFMTNTNLQHYSGESGLSNFSQMAVITMMMFTSAATGYSACMAMLRGFCGKDMGNYFVDMVRITTRVMLPLAIIVGLVLVSQGVPQTLSNSVTVTTIEGTLQDIPLGPVASLEAIKHIGTNGGGFFGGNSTTPLENPNILTNLIELFMMMLLPGACVVAFGLMCYHRKDDGKQKKNIIMGGEGATVFTAMSLLFIAGIALCYYAESSGNPVLSSLGLESGITSMEGKETRIGVAQSVMFSVVTTAFSTGTVNNMHDTLSPLGGMVAMLNMMLNNVFGGIGVGLMNMILYVLLAVFLCGLMTGKTPEYLGKKIESREMKLIVLCISLHAVLILGFSALAVSVESGLAGISNPKFHGLSQILYEFSSSAANNGSGFEGLSDNSTFWNITTGLVMFLARYIPIILQLAIAGSLLSKNEMSVSSASLDTSGVTFGAVVASVVLVFAALTFLPAVALGPVAEYLTIAR